MPQPVKPAPFNGTHFTPQMASLLNKHLPSKRADHREQFLDSVLKSIENRKLQHPSLLKSSSRWKQEGAFGNVYGAVRPYLHALDASERLAAWRLKGLQEIPIRLEDHSFQSVVDKLQTWHESNRSSMIDELSAPPAAPARASTPEPTALQRSHAVRDSAASLKTDPITYGRVQHGYDPIEALERLVGTAPRVPPQRSGGLQPLLTPHENLIQKLLDHAGIRQEVHAMVDDSQAPVLFQALAYALKLECDRMGLERITDVELTGLKPWPGLFVTAWLSPNRGHQAIVSLGQVLRSSDLAARGKITMRDAASK
jgi:hypothetical protein